jgi:hypothetical protein
MPSQRAHELLPILSAASPWKKATRERTDPRRRPELQDHLISSVPLNNSRVGRPDLPFGPQVAALIIRNLRIH